MDERPTERTVTLVVPLPDRTDPSRPVRAPYVERSDRTVDRTPRPVERTETERETVRPNDRTTGRPEPVRPAVRPAAERTLQWQTIDTPTERTVRELPGDGGRTLLKTVAVAIPVTGVAGIACGLVSSLWPLAVLAGVVAAGALVALLVRFARWLTDAIVREAQ